MFESKPVLSKIRARFFLFRSESKHSETQSNDGIPYEDAILCRSTSSSSVDGTNSILFVRYGCNFAPVLVRPVGARASCRRMLGGGGAFSSSRRVVESGSRRRAVPSRVSMS